jgi:hypothetical protein
MLDRYALCSEYNEKWFHHYIVSDGTANTVKPKLFVAIEFGAITVSLMSSIELGWNMI